MNAHNMMIGFGALLLTLTHVFPAPNSTIIMVVIVSLSFLLVLSHVEIDSQPREPAILGSIPINNGAGQLIRSYIHLRPQLARGLEGLWEIPHFATHSPGKLKEAVQGLELFFSTADNLIVSGKKKSDVSVRFQELRDLRASALNSLHSLQFSVTKKKILKKLYKTVQLARLETIRSMSVIVTKFQPIGIDWRPPAPFDLMDEYRNIFIA